MASKQKSTIDIRSEHYQVFYKKIRDKVYEEFFGNDSKDYSKYSPSIWVGKKVKEPIFTKLFEGIRTRNPHYFYRKKTELQPQKTVKGSVDVLAFVKGLEYIGIVPPSDIANYAKFNIEQKAEILYERFIELYNEEIKEKSSSTSNFIPSSPHIENSNSNLTAAQYTIQKFYENIASKNIREAWELLSSEFQNKRPWLGDFEKFEIGYTNTNTLRAISIFDIKQSVPNIIVGKVFYEDEISVYTNKELSSLDVLTIDDLPAFIEKVEKMKSHFESKGLSNFKNIELYKLFDPAASEYIWYKSNFPPDQLHDVFTTQKNIIVKRIYECSCILKNEQWLINNIHALKSYSVR